MATMRRRDITMLSLLMVVVLTAVPSVSGTRWTVGSNRGWSPNVNYTIWAQDKQFILDDWLFFVYDRNQQNVLEVNKTNYETCNSDHPKHNWTTGAGRDVVPLNVTRDYYFISGNGFCYSGMKLAVHVIHAPPPPKSSPLTSGASTFNYRGQIVIPAAFAIAALWDSFTRLW